MKNLETEERSNNFVAILRRKISRLIIFTRYDSISLIDSDKDY